MTPFHFGPPERRLFGLYHAPERGGVPPAALLMCQPFGQEASRAHRLYRVIADRLARQGVAVLRFDYFGAGDSEGDDEDGEMTGWRLDVLRAHEELRRRSGARAIDWFGARLGATLAIQAAAQVPGLRRMVLWDPVLDGRAYVQELQAAQLAMLELGFYAKDRSWYEHDGGDHPIAEALGYRIGVPLATQFEALMADRLTLPPNVQVTVFHDPDDVRTPPWCSRERERGHSLVEETLEHPIVWTSEPIPNQAIVPGDVTRRIVSALK